MSKIPIDCECPYCHASTKNVLAEVLCNGTVQPQIIPCVKSSEHYGCGEWFILRATLTINATVSRMPEEQITQKVNGNGKTVPAEGVPHE